MYDLIGDIHGHADELVALLAKMGYRETGGAWRHPERTAVFVGDFIDRGPKILETLKIVRPMLEEETAQAVLGNHEWNAFGYHLEDPDEPGKYLREHSDKNTAQHRATLDQVPADTLACYLEFLRKLPVRLSLPGVNVVHACWDEEAFGVIDEALARLGGVTDAFVIEGSRKGTRLYKALEVALKGKEMDLPEGVSFRGQGRPRAPRGPGAMVDDRRPRPRSGATRCRGSTGSRAHRSRPEAVAEARRYPADLPPVFFGHYWLDDPAPAPLAANVACLDYSVAKHGFLCAYRLDGESTLDARRFETVAAA